MSKNSKIQRTHKEDVEKRRSFVRRFVTYCATGYAFGGGVLLVALMAKWPNKFTEAKELYLAILPIATGVITYWFATRKPEESSSKNEDIPEKPSPEKKDPSEKNDEEGDSNPQPKKNPVS